MRVKLFSIAMLFIAILNSKDFANEWEELEEVEFGPLDSLKDLSCS